jgi:hypothetical protein
MAVRIRKNQYYKNSFEGIYNLKLAVLWIRISIRRIRMFLGLPDPHPDPLVTGTERIWLRILP